MQASSAASTSEALVAANDRLVELASKLAPSPGSHETSIAGLTLFRSDSSATCQWGVCEPSLCFIIQGTKTVRFGDREIHFPPMSYLANNIHLPIQAGTLDATPETPYLGAKIVIDPNEVAELVLELGDRLPQHAFNRECSEVSCGLCRAHMGRDMQEPLERLLALLENPDDAPALAPLARREILYRALMSELGATIRRFATVDSQSHRISQVVSILQERFTEPLRVSELAEQANMSESALFHSFKRATRMSPLQFQKKLRLHEARRLMLLEGLETASASYRVGYESPSQFSREYRRLFGAPPRADVTRLRGTGESIPA
jgi:AraC-like DNA-binding protein